MDQKDGLDNLLMDYCRSGDPLLIEYLLDNGVDPDEGGLFHFIDPLVTAIISEQPPWIIEKMIRHGAKVDSLDVVEAIKYERLDILELLLDNCRWKIGGLRKVGMKRALQAAKEIGNKRSLQYWRIISETRKGLGVAGYS